MDIRGIDGMTMAEIEAEIEHGGKFVMYQYCVSLLVITLRRPSDVYFIKGGKSAVGPGLQFSGLSLLLGWWGLPWGLIYTPTVIANNFAGGKNITGEVLRVLDARYEKEEVFGQAVRIG